MTKRCAHCGGRFGLPRYTAYRLGAIVQFCSKKCERTYFEALRARLTEGTRWFAYLAK